MSRVDGSGLTHHIGRTHRWAAAYVGDGRTEPMGSDELDRLWGALPADTELPAWFHEGHERAGGESRGTLLAFPV